VSAEALPHTLLILLIELTIGSLWITLFSDLRGEVTRGFVLTMALLIAVMAGLTYWTATSISWTDNIDGYLIDQGWLRTIQHGLLAVLAAASVYAFGVFMGWDPIGRIAAIGGAIGGLIVVVALAAMLNPPIWFYLGGFAALLTGTLAMGAVSTSMIWGHWYLTEGSLPPRPLRELTLILISAIGLQTLFFVVNAVIPERTTPITAIGSGLLDNPMFYFRIGVGLIFSLVLAIFAFKTTQIRAMQSATGLLYVCMATVFTGEVLARGLQFISGHPL
tara:strand:- start:200 stop:1027 length:828 start_codon:yes stop_codon:yes gene_type:complete